MIRLKKKILHFENHKQCDFLKSTYLNTEIFDIVKKLHTPTFGNISIIFMISAKLRQQNTTNMIDREVKSAREDIRAIKKTCGLGQVHKKCYRGFHGYKTSEMLLKTDESEAKNDQADTKWRKFH